MPDTHGDRVDGTTAAALAAERGWRLFPVSDLKRPILRGSWADYATADPDELCALWDRCPGRRAWIAVATGLNGLVVFDRDFDRDAIERIDEASAGGPAATLTRRRSGLSGRAELELLDGAGTLIMRSKSGRSHYYFVAPDPPVEVHNGHWSGGDIRGVGPVGGGYVVWTGETETPAELRPVPPALLAVYARRATGTPAGGSGATGSRVGGATSTSTGPAGALDPATAAEWRTAMRGTIDGPDWDGTDPIGAGLWPETVDSWEATPGALDGEPVWVRWMVRPLGRLRAKVDEGQHRRTAALAEVLALALEAAAGYYPAEVAYYAGEAVYAELRDACPRRATTGDKGWSRFRRRDYERMWEGASAAIDAGFYEEALAEKRRVTDAGWREWESEIGLTDWYGKIAPDPDGPDPDTGRSPDPDGIAPARHDGGGPSVAPESTGSTVSSTVSTGSELPPAVLIEPEPGGADPPTATLGSVRADDLAPAAPPDEYTPPAYPAEAPFVGAAAGDPTVLLPPRSASEPYERGPETGPRRPHGTGRFGGDDDPPPVLASNAYYGPIGEFAREAATYSEAPEAGILLAGLITLGFTVGPACYIQLGNAPHGPCDYAVLVARSGEGKDIAQDLGRGLVLGLPTEPPEVALDWQARSRVIGGIASGEALTDLWRPEPDPADETGKTVIKPDRRVLFRESEMGSVMARISREASTLGYYLRTAWDRTGPLEHRTATSAKAGPAKVVLSVLPADYWVGLLVNGTPSEIRRNLRSVDVAGGTANRFLWAVIGKPLALHPDGGNVPLAVVTKHRANLRAALTRLDLLKPSTPGATVVRLPARGPVEYVLTDQPCYPWYADEVYPRLTRERAERGPAAADMTARLPAHLWRLAQIYALSVGERDRITDDCFSAALAICDWSARSTEWLFGSRTGNASLDAYLAVVYDAGPDGLPAREAQQHFGPGHSKLRDEALALGMVTWHQRKTGAGRGGRPASVAIHRDHLRPPPR